MYLEYRKLDETILFHVTDIDPNLLKIRKMCDYLIKQGKVYVKEDEYVENDLHIIYITMDEEEKPFTEHVTDYHRTNIYHVEVREYMEDAEFHPIIITHQYQTLWETLSFIQKEEVEEKGIRYSKSSLELDEDRNAIVFYVTKNG